MLNQNRASLVLSWKVIALAIIIVLFAFALRVQVIFDRARADSEFLLQPGVDQTTYYVFAQQLRAGEWPDSAFQYQPGMVYYVAAIQLLLPPVDFAAEVGLARLYVALTGALSCGWLIGAGWLVRRRVWDGFSVGLLYAIYPVAIFSATDFLNESLATPLVCLLLFLILWQSERLSFVRTILIGLVLGIMTLTRFNLLTIIPVCLLFLVLIAHTWRERITHSALTIVCVGLAILPVTLTNLHFGVFQLITDSKMDEVYIPNNRDADGFRNFYLAAELVHVSYTDYGEAMWKDIRYDPRRFLELQLRKTGIYWNAIEGGNNLNYMISGLRVSPLLRLIPLNFRILAALGLLGLVPIFLESRQKGWLLLLLNLMIFVGIMPIHIEGRLRWTAIPPLALSGGVLIIALGELLIRREWQRLRYYLPTAGAVVLFLILANWAYENLPRDRHYTKLPPDLHPVHIMFDDNLELIGWRSPEEWGVASQRGWLNSGEITDDIYLVEFLWRVTKETDEDYHQSVKYMIDGRQFAGVDGPIGRVSFPFDLTSTWAEGVIYAETVGFHVSKDAPTMRSGSVMITVYKTDDEDGNQAVIPIENGDVFLQYLAVYPDDMQPTGDVAATAHVFGDQITLIDYKVPATVGVNATFAIDFNWQALNEIDKDYVRFIHLMDQQGNLVGGTDSPPRNGQLTTSTWRPGIVVSEDVEVTAPDTPGTYSIYIGWYDSEFNRLPAGTDDNRVYLGEITVVDD